MHQNSVNLYARTVVGIQFSNHYQCNTNNTINQYNTIVVGICLLRCLLVASIFSKDKPFYRHQKQSTSVSATTKNIPKNILNNKIEHLRIRRISQNKTLYVLSKGRILNP